MTVVYTPTATNETNAQEFDDGDAPSAAIINPLGEAAFNTAKWAANRVGTYRLINVYTWTYDNGTAPYTWNAFITATFAAAGSGGTYGLAGTVLGDKFVCHVTGVAELDSTTTEYGELSLYCNENGAGDTPVTAARTMLQIPVNKLYPFAMSGIRTIAAPGSVQFTVVGRVSTVGGGQNLKVQSVLSMIIEHWRLNT